MTAETSASALAQACLQRIQALEPTVQAWAHLDVPVLMQQAQALDRFSADERAAAPLWAWTVGIKDIIDTADKKRTLEQITRDLLIL